VQVEVKDGRIESSGPDGIIGFGEIDNLPNAGDFLAVSPVLRAAVNAAFKLRIL